MSILNYTLFLSLLPLLMISAGCCNHDCSVPTTEQYTISISEGGGFTGIVDGCTLSSEGKVQFWKEMPGKEAEILFEKDGDIATIGAFQKTLADSSFFKEEIKEAGNMTSVLSYKNGETDISWVWESGAEADGMDKKQLFSLFADIKSFCEEIKK